MKQETIMDTFEVPQGFTEARQPELYKFEHKGDVLEGILTKAVKVQIGGDEVLELYINNGRKIVKIRPGYDIRAKVTPQMVGKRVHIRYIGDDDSAGKKGNAMKVFCVAYKEPDPATDEDLGITDDDIPF
jgi:hypothetical protein